MRRRLPVRAFGGAAFVALLTCSVAACGDDSEAVTTPSTTVVAPEPWGRSFLATDGPPVRIEFTAEHEVRAQIECNTLSGAATLDADVLLIEALSGTEMGCDPERQEQDEELAAFLTSGPTLALDGNTLTLTGEDDTLVLLDRVVADPDRPLEGTRWVVDSLIDGDAVSSLPEGAGEAYLELAAGAVSGSGGCNEFSGDAVVDDGTITFGPLTTTDVACDETTMQLEAAVLAVLKGEVEWDVDARMLTLTGTDDADDETEDGPLGLGLRAN
jgi:heat shock protein HslJ